jgi:hypothetical protein
MTNTTNDTINNAINNVINTVTNNTLLDLTEIKSNTINETNNVITDNDLHYFSCPHCGISIEVDKKQINCKIFRCGLYKSDYRQIPPHAPKTQCDEYVKKDLIFGCGKPFTFDGSIVNICDYI